MFQTIIEFRGGKRFFTEDVRLREKCQDRELNFPVIASYMNTLVMRSITKDYTRTVHLT